MAISTIQDIPFQRLPWLTVGNVDDTAKVDQFITHAQLELQTALNKSDADVEVEASYSKREKLLVGLYTCLLLSNDKAIENSAGKNGGSASGNKVVTKAKADVVETEFSIIKESDGSSLVINLTNLTKALKTEICSLAGSMGVSLAICYDGGISPVDVGVSYGFTCGLNGCC